MPEDVIKARIIFDTGGLAGGTGRVGGAPAAATGGGLAAAGGPSVVKIAKGVALGNILTKGITTLTQKLVAASPRLQNSLNILNKSLMMFLRPIADTIGLVLRPFAFAMLKWAIAFYKWWLSGPGKNIRTALETPKEERDFVENATVLALTTAIIALTVAMATRALAPGLGAGGAVKAGLAVAALPIAFEGAKTLHALLTRVIQSFHDFIFDTFGIDLRKVVADAFLFLTMDLPLIVKNLGPIFDQLWFDVKTFVVDEVTTPIMDAWTELKDSVMDNFITPVTDAWNDLKKHVDEKFITPVKNAWTKFKDWIDTSIITPIKDYWLLFVTWIDDNVITPIQTAWTSFVSAASSAIADAIAAVKRFFRIGGDEEDDNRPKPTMAVGADFILTKTGRMIKTDPNDTLFATKNPEGMMGTNVGPINITVQALDASAIDDTLLDNLAQQLEDRIKRGFMGRTTEVTGI